MKLHKLMFSKNYVWITNMVIGSGLFAAGDLFEQTIEIRRNFLETIDLRRTCRMATMGLITGPAHQMLFGMLEKFYPGRTNGATWKKVILDQVVSGPFFNFHFFVGMGLLEGKSIQDAWEEFLRKFSTVFITELIVWVPCQYANFAYVPLQYRVFFVNSITFFWNIYLSYMKHYDQYQSAKPTKDGCPSSKCDCHQNKRPFILHKLACKLRLKKQN